MVNVPKHERKGRKAERVETYTTAVLIKIVSTKPNEIYNAQTRTHNMIKSVNGRRGVKVEKENKLFCKVDGEIQRLERVRPRNKVDQ